MVAALAFAAEEKPDTIVISVGEPDIAPEGKRMQVQLKSGPNAAEWHRRIPGLPETACELRIDPRAELAIRFEQLVGVLCPTCFLPRERAIAAAANARIKKEEE